ncbi:MAG: hypothetical protein MRZ79_27075 [Bacteroidia bacterium]|nr:hypothetical protein [Bacteroidia bacterium]
MKYLSYLLALVFTLTMGQAQGQNGWVRKSKGLYAQLTATHFSSNSYYSTEGVLFNEGSTFISQGLLFYGEYGLTDRFTAVLDLPVVMLNRFNTTGVVGGLGSAKLGLKYGLSKSIPISLAVDIEIPTDDGINFATAKEPNSLGTFDQINLPTSDGEFNVWTTLAASHSFPNGKTFGSIFAAANFRTQSFSHQFQSGLEIGHLFFNKLYLIGKLRIQERLSNGDAQTASFLYGEGTTFTSYGLTGMYNLNQKWKLVASFSDISNFISNRRNIYDGFTLNLGVAVEY